MIDGLKIGGIENQALTLSAEESRDEENFLVNLNKYINSYSNKFFYQKQYQNLKIISLKRKKSFLMTFMIYKLFKKNKPLDVIIYFNNINTLWVVLGAKFAGINNIAICVQNSLVGLSINSYKSLILLKIFNKFKVKLVPAQTQLECLMRILMRR